MKHVQLRAVKTPEVNWEEMEKRIKDEFLKALYLPLMEIFKVKSKRLQNSKDDLLAAIRSGQIAYVRGSFRGKFSAAISKELIAMGAEWDKASKVFALPVAKLSPDIFSAISASEATMAKVASAINKKIVSVNPKALAAKIDFGDIFDDALWKANKHFKDNVKKISLPHKVTEREAQVLNKTWRDNIEISIKKFTQEHIKELRDKVNKHVLRGSRQEDLAKEIEKSYGVTERKARFISRQETNMMLSKFNQERYESVGVNKYKWVCVHMPKDGTPKQHTPGNVRYYHGLLDGTVQEFSKPPVVSKNPERRANPGVDYNCRCAMVPIVEFKKKEVKDES